MNIKIKKKCNQNNLKSCLFYSLKFTSIISPGNLLNFKLVNFYDNKFADKKYLKIFIKQSYMLLTWIIFLKKKNFSNKTTTPSFFVYPLKTSQITMTKAPMAHKTFSQEQYFFKFYYLVISFKIKNKITLPSINSSFFFILKQRKKFFLSGTNLLFLKRYNVILNSKDKDFFKLW